MARRLWDSGRSVRFLTPAVSLAWMVISAGIAHADPLPVFYGPGDKNNVDAEQSFVPGSPVNNAGVAIGMDSPVVANVNLGQRPFRWEPTLNVVPTRLGTGAVAPDDDLTAYVTAISNSGIIVGSGGTPFGNRALRYTAGSTAPEILEAFPGPPGNGSYINAVNNSGNAVGVGSAGNDGQHAARWVPGSTTPQQLGSISHQTNNHYDSRANAVNEAGSAVGSGTRYAVTDQSLGERAIRWSPANVGVELQPISIGPGGVATSAAYAINTAGVAVGSSTLYDGFADIGPRGVRWNVGSTAATQLGALGTDLNGYGTSIAFAINDGGPIAGVAIRYNAAGDNLGQRAVRWAPNSTTPIELGNLGTLPDGTTDGLPIAMNDSGTIGGVMTKYSGTTSLGYHATIWLPGTTAAIDLNTRITAVVPGGTFTATRVQGISDTGFVTGLGTVDDGAGGFNRLYTMMIPEAGTYGRGDATLDGKVNFNDLVVLAQKYNALNPTRDVHVADFNLDAITNFPDLVVLAQNYNSGGAIVDGLGGADFARDWALAQSLVPEPSLMIVGAIALVSRRRRIV